MGNVKLNCSWHCFTRAISDVLYSFINSRLITNSNDWDVLGDMFRGCASRPYNKTGMYLFFYDLRGTISDPGWWWWWSSEPSFCTPAAAAAAPKVAQLATCRPIRQRRCRLRVCGAVNVGLNRRLIYREARPAAAAHPMSFWQPRRRPARPAKLRWSHRYVWVVIIRRTNWIVSAQRSTLFACRKPCAHSFETVLFQFVRSV